MGQVLLKCGSSSTSPSWLSLWVRSSIKVALLQHGLSTGTAVCVSFMGPYKRVDVVCSVEETWVSWVLIASFFSVPPHMMLMPQEALPVGYDSL